MKKHSKTKTDGWSRLYNFGSIVRMHMICKFMQMLPYGKLHNLIPCLPKSLPQNAAFASGVFGHQIELD